MGEDEVEALRQDVHGTVDLGPADDQGWEHADHPGADGVEEAQLPKGCGDHALVGQPLDLVEQAFAPLDFPTLNY